MPAVISTLLFAAFPLLSTPSPVGAFALATARWDPDANGNVRIRINPDGLHDMRWLDRHGNEFYVSRDQWRNGVEKAVATWNQVTATNQLRAFFVTTPGDAEVHFTMTTSRADWTHVLSETVPTSTRFSKQCNGLCPDRIESAEILINTEEPWSILDRPVPEQRVDVETAILHELGHVLRLEHSPQASWNANCASLMFGDLPIGVAGQPCSAPPQAGSFVIHQASDISRDDVCGLRALYGREPCGGFVRGEVGAPDGHLEGALIRLLGPDGTVVREAMTDSAGRYELADVPGGEAEIEASRDGTAATSLPVTVLADAYTDVPLVSLSALDVAGGQTRSEPSPVWLLPPTGLAPFSAAAYATYAPQMDSYTVTYHSRDDAEFARLSGAAGSVLKDGDLQWPLECEPGRDYCAPLVQLNPVATPSVTLEWFSGLAVNGNPAVVRHSACCGSPAWVITWYDASARSSYQLEFFEQAARAFGGTQPSPDNRQVAEQIAAVAGSLEEDHPSATPTPSAYSDTPFVIRSTNMIDGKVFAPTEPISFTFSKPIDRNSLIMRLVPDAVHETDLSDSDAVMTISPAQTWGYGVTRQITVTAKSLDGDPLDRTYTFTFTTEQ